MGKLGPQNTYPGNFGAWLDETMSEWGIDPTPLSKSYAAVTPLGKPRASANRRTSGAPPKNPEQIKYLSEIKRWRSGKEVPGRARAYRLGIALASLGVPTCGVQVVARVAGDQESYYAADAADLLLSGVLRSAATTLADVMLDPGDGEAWDAAYLDYYAAPDRARENHPPHLVAMFEVLDALLYRRRG